MHYSLQDNRGGKSREDNDIGFLLLFNKVLLRNGKVSSKYGCMHRENTKTRCLYEILFETMRNILQGELRGNFTLFSLPNNSKTTRIVIGMLRFLYSLTTWHSVEKVRNIVRIFLPGSTFFKVNLVNHLRVHYRNVIT